MLKALIVLNRVQGTGMKRVELSRNVLQS
jgi:hypothetical protein